MELILKPELAEALKTAERECKNPYAQTYLRAVPQAIQEGVSFSSFTPEGSLQTQLLYCISNMAHWRGNTARKVKAVLKRFTKEQPFVQGTDAKHN